jgi:hypothetical protein
VAGNQRVWHFLLVLVGPLLDLAVERSEGFVVVGGAGVEDVELSSAPPRDPWVSLGVRLALVLS